MVQENIEDESNPIRFDALKLKNEMVTVITNLYQTYKLQEIMPLLSLLNVLEVVAAAKNLQQVDDGNGPIKVTKYWTDNISVFHKITYILNRVQTETALLVGVQNALTKSNQVSNTKVFFKELGKEHIYAQQTRKLFIVILKHVLHDNNVAIEQLAPFGVNIEENNPNKIFKDQLKITCVICNKFVITPMHLPIDNICVCTNYPAKDKTNQVTGTLEITVKGSACHYDHTSINSIFGGSLFPCSKRTIGNNDCKCSNPLKTVRNQVKTEYKRMVVITVDGKFKTSSEFSRSRIIGLNEEIIHLSNNKEMELQLWERSSGHIKGEAINLIATSRIELKNVIGCTVTTDFVFEMEPDGIMKCALKFTAPAAVNAAAAPKFEVKRTHGITRRKAIKGNIMYSIQSRFKTDNKYNVSSWCNIFQNDVHKFILGKKKEIINKNKQGSIFRNVLKSIFNKIMRHSGEKLNISCNKSQKLEPKSNDRYINLQKSPIPHGPRLNEINPRGPKVPFYLGPSKTPLFRHQTKLDLVNCSKSIHETHCIQTPNAVNDISAIQCYNSPIRHAKTTKVMLCSTPLENANKIPSAGTSPIEGAPKSHVVTPQNSTYAPYLSNMFESFTISQCNVTRSNLDVRKVDEDFQHLNKSIVANKYGDSDDEDHFREADNHMELNIIEYGRDECVPVSCSEDLHNLMMFYMDETMDENANQSVVDVAHVDKLDISKFALLTVLGQGHFGKVLLAEFNQGPREGSLCALKVMNKEGKITQPEIDCIYSEKKILQTITDSNHPFLVGLIGCFQTETQLVFALDYCCGGDMMAHIHKQAFGESRARFYAVCVILALEFLHDHDIMYRDLKLDNLLMDCDGYVKITDFGLSKQNMGRDTKTRTFCGTPEFLAPEVLTVEQTGGGYTRAVDWWAFGVLLYEMVLGDTPFPGDNDLEIFEAIRRGFVDVEDLSAECTVVVRRLLVKKPSARLGSVEGAAEVRRQAFFRDVDWDRMLARTLPAPFVPTLEHYRDTSHFEVLFTSLPVTMEHLPDDSDDEEDNDKGEKVPFVDVGQFANFDEVASWSRVSPAPL